MRLTHGGSPTAGVASWGSCGLWGTGLASAPSPPLTLHHGLELGDSQMGPSEGASAFESRSRPPSSRPSQPVTKPGGGTMAISTPQPPLMGPGNLSVHWAAGTRGSLPTPPSSPARSPFLCWCCSLINLLLPHKSPQLWLSAGLLGTLIRCTSSTPSVCFHLMGSCLSLGFTAGEGSDDLTPAPPTTPSTQQAGARSSKGLPTAEASASAQPKGRH